MRPTTLEFVCVQWKDAQSSAAESMDIHSVDEHHAPAIMFSYGFLVKWDKEGVSVCSEVDEDGGFRGHTYVEAANVLHIWRVSANPFTKRKVLYRRVPGD